MRLGLQIIWNQIAGAEREPKRALQIPHRFRRCINRHRATCVRKSPKIIEAHDVIGVRVRENDRIDFADIFAKRLGPEIGPSVHHERALGRFDIDRRTQPLIARIWRSTHIAIATNHWHTLRRSGAEERELKR